MLSETRCHPSHSHQAVYGRDGSMIQVLGAQNLSVLELNEIELANGVESDV